jgi:hypothetical protein
MRSIVSHHVKHFHIVKGIAMSAVMQSAPESIPAFCEGIQYFADSFPEIDRLGASPLLGPNQPALPDATSEASIYQTLLAADALRYLTLQVTGSKSSGHPGGFASSADAVAALPELLAAADAALLFVRQVEPFRRMMGDNPSPTLSALKAAVLSAIARTG